jgi:hypothetical protein
MEGEGDGLGTMGRESEGRKRKGCLHVRGMDGGRPSSVEEREIIKGKKKMGKKNYV